MAPPPARPIASVAPSSATDTAQSGSASRYQAAIGMRAATTTTAPPTSAASAWRRKCGGSGWSSASGAVALNTATAPMLASRSTLTPRAAAALVSSFGSREARPRVASLRAGAFGPGLRGCFCEAGR